MCTVRELKDFIFVHWGHCNVLLITPKESVETDIATLMNSYNDYVVYGFTYNETLNKLTIRAKERVCGETESSER